MSFALVVWASSGLGKDLAYQLAEQGYNLVLAARSAVPMEAFVAEIRDKHDVSVTVIPLDLSLPGSADLLLNQLDQHGISPQVLINNASFDLSEHFLQHDSTRLSAMLQLNVVALTELSHRFGRGCRNRVVVTFCWWLAWPHLCLLLCSRLTQRAGLMCFRWGKP